MRYINIFYHSDILLINIFFSDIYEKKISKICKLIIAITFLHMYFLQFLYGILIYQSNLSLINCNIIHFYFFGLSDE